MPRLIRQPVALLTAAVFAFALTQGSFVAGGSDSYGYVSQARLWAQGAPITREPLMMQVTWADADQTFAPLGYKPGIEPGTIVPVYSVGYPMLMGLIQRILGHDAEMVVVPLMSAGLVACTAMIGTTAGGATVGLLSGVLLATSPPFVYQSLQPMSDIPVAFWWTLSAWLAISRRRAANIASGATTFAAILTRPNLIPLAAPLVVLGVLTSRQHDRRGGQTTAAALTIGTVMGAIATAAVNTIFYGGPAISGYGDPRDLYALHHAWTNVPRYLGWLIDSETLLVAGSLAGIVVLARGSALQRAIAFYAAAVLSIVLSSYLFYRPFESWTYVRFLLPMYPFMFVTLLSVTAIRPLHDRPMARTIVFAGLTLIILSAHVRYAQYWHLLSTKVSERRYVVVADYAQNAFPANAVFISMQHSGSVQYYGNRKTVRYDWLPPAALDEAVEQLTKLGFKPYFLFEDWEEPRFRARFGEFSRLGKLDWPPTFALRSEGIRIYDPAER